MVFTHRLIAPQKSPAGDGEATARAGRTLWVAGLMGIMADAFRVAERGLAPPADLLIRLWLAQGFLISGLLKISNWDNALTLARYEYPVAWMDPVTAAYVGATIELICPLLLAVGLATRLAALPLLILSLVIQFNYVALDSNLLTAALFGWYVVRGAGGFALDRHISRGLVGSALPLAAAGARFLQAFTRLVGPVYQLGLRLWLAGALAFIGFSIPTGSDPGASAAAWLPVNSAAAIDPGVALVTASLLVAGLATRFTTLGLVGLLLLLPMAGAWQVHHLYWLMPLGLLMLYGSGPIALDELIERRLKRIFPQLEGKPAFALEGLPRVVIVGAGFGGLACAAGLRRAPVSVTLIDRHNYHLFQPLLYQIATAGLSPADIATPVRGLFREYFNTRVLLGTVTGVNAARREVLLGEQRVPYDYLVLATGARHSYFGRDEWEPYAPGLKRIEDATEVRRRLLLAFERAEATDDPAERQALLTFLIVGGGPTGVELAGAIAELARYGMEKEFRRFDPAMARVMLVQAGPRLLPTFPEPLSAKARRSLERLGVEVLTDSRVEDIDAHGVMVNGQRIAARTVLWAAGVVASPAAQWLGVPADRAGRLKVGPDLSVPGMPNVFALGDTTLSEAWAGQPVPGLASAAKQGGDYVARVIRARIQGHKSPGPFVYRHLGSLATIGRKAAVADFGWLRLSGAPAWWLWGLVHVFFLVGLRNRVSVMFDWFWSYLTFRGGSRLITGDNGTTDDILGRS